ncbi:MAG: hypothetical protein BGO45_08550 [Microbacterium sp. 71-36]|nr:MAG: hypothetical protein ABS60_12740 [Microbacterium sp. SCN 71-17]OJV76874.1 MAG: hypothetical protein BGO45_08550 [Microbacterium sp. 71-36]
MKPAIPKTTDEPQNTTIGRISAMLDAPDTEALRANVHSSTKVKAESEIVESTIDVVRPRSRGSRGELIRSG